MSRVKGEQLPGRCGVCRLQILTFLASALAVYTLLNSRNLSVGAENCYFNVDHPGFYGVYEAVGQKVGDRIVGLAFNTSYYDLVENCGKHYQMAYTRCLLQLSTLGNNQHLQYAQKWPWWFRTLLRDASKPKTQVQGPWHILQYRDPNIQQCISEKSGTKVWRRLHCATIGNKTGKALAQGLKEKITEFNCARLQEQRIPKSDRVVFLRDPLDRFLSGFLDKCTGSKLYLQSHCEPLVIYHNKETSLVNEFISDKRKLFEIYVDTFPLAWNLHFFPQSLYCDGLHRHIREYDFVGSMDRQLHQDLGQFRTMYPELGAPIDAFFKLNQTSNSIKNGVETKASGQTQDYFSPYTVRKVLQYYAIDYVMLDIPVPDWAEVMLALGPTELL